MPDYLHLCPLSPSVTLMGSPEWLLSPLWEALGVHSSMIPSSLSHLCFLGCMLCHSFYCSSLCSIVRSLSKPWAFSVWHVCTHRHTHVNCESSVQEAGFLGQPACSWGHMACIRAWVLGRKAGWLAISLDLARARGMLWYAKAGLWGPNYVWPMASTGYFKHLVWSSVRFCQSKYFINLNPPH